MNKIFLILSITILTSFSKPAAVQTYVITDSSLTGYGVDGSPLSVNRAVGFIPPLTVTWDGNGATVITGATTTIYKRIPYDCTIAGWSIVATGSSPTCTIDIWKVASGTSLPTVGNTITGTKPALASGNAVASVVFTAWSTLAVTAGDILAFNVDACSNATFIDFTFTLQ